MKNKLLLTLLLFTAAITASAIEFEVDGICYHGYGNSAVVYDYNSSIITTGDVVIPETVTYDDVSYSVTRIYNYAFDRSNIKSVVIPNSVTYIGTGAFMECLNLTNVNIGSSVTYIDNAAFESCGSLTSVTIPNSVTYIGIQAFQGCCSLNSLIIGKSVEQIDAGAFLACSSLMSITVDSDNPYYDSRGNCNAIIETSSNKLITGSGNTVIPETVTSIGDYAFFECAGLTSVTIPNSVTNIGSAAFFDCPRLKEVSIGRSVEYISSGGVFTLCPSLSSISVDSLNPYYDSRDDCNAIIETSNNSLIYGCKNTIIPNSVTSISEDAFIVCTGLTSITIPNSVTEIGFRAFEECSSLTSVIIGNSVTSIGEEAFYGCKALSHVTCLATIPPVVDNKYSFDSFTYSDGMLYVPYKSLSAYKEAEVWKEFVNIHGLGDLDGDGGLSVGDVTNMIDDILAGRINYEDNPAADVNGDGKISIADITDLIDQLLNASN